MILKQNQTTNVPCFDWIPVEPKEDVPLKEAQSLFEQSKVDPQIGIELLKTYKPLSVSLFQKQWGSDYQTKQMTTWTRLEEMQLKESLRNFIEDCRYVSTLFPKNGTLEEACFYVNGNRSKTTLNSEHLLFKNYYLFKYPEKTLLDFYKYQVMKKNQHAALAQKLLAVTTLEQEMKLWNEYSEQKSFKVSLNHFLTKKRNNRYWDQEIQTIVKMYETQYLRKFPFIPMEQEQQAITFFQYQAIKSLDHAELCYQLLVTDSLGKRDSLWNNYEKLDCLKNEFHQFCHKDDLRQEAEAVVSGFEEGIYNHYPFFPNYSEEAITQFLLHQMKHQQRYHVLAEQLLEARTLEERAMLWNSYDQNKQEKFRKQLEKFVKNKKIGPLSSNNPKTFLSIYPKETVQSFLQYQVKKDLAHAPICQQLLESKIVKEQERLFRCYEKKKSLTVLFCRYVKTGGKNTDNYPFLSHYSSEAITQALCYQVEHSKVYADFSKKMLEAPNGAVRLKLYRENPNRVSYVECVRQLIKKEAKPSNPSIPTNPIQESLEQDRTVAFKRSQFQEKKDQLRSGERIQWLEQFVPSTGKNLLQHLTYSKEEMSFQMGFQMLQYPTFRQLFEDDFQQYEKRWKEAIINGNPYACNLYHKYLLLWDHDFHEVLEGNQFYYISCLYATFLHGMEQEKRQENSDQKVKQKKNK